MNAAQKRAWLCVISMVVCIVGYLVLVPPLGLVRAFSAFSFFAVNGFSPFIGHKEKLDERDKSIHRRAALGGGMSSYCFFIIGCIGSWTFYHRSGHKLIPAEILPLITMFGVVTFYFVYSLAILILYGRKVEADNV